jgi:MFS family permease
VLFLTGVWHEEVLTAGLMLFPGPAMAACFAIPGARLGARFGYRLPGVLGSLMFAAGSAWYILRTGDQPNYAADFLPGNLITGAGVGLVIPTLTGAGVSALAPQRFATGAAILTMGRQIGVALGVALLVAVLGSGDANAADFHLAWLITVLGGLATAAVLAAIGPPVASPVAGREDIEELIALDPLDVAELPSGQLNVEAAYPMAGHK